MTSDFQVDTQVGQAASDFTKQVYVITLSENQDSVHGGQ